MVRTRARLSVGLVGLVLGVSAGAVSIGWLRRPSPATQHSVSEQRQLDDSKALADVVGALGLDSRDRDALLRLDAMLPYMFDPETGLPNGSGVRGLRDLPTLLQNSATTPAGQTRLGRILLVLGLNHVASSILIQAAPDGSPDVTLPLAIALLRTHRLAAVLELSPALASSGQEQAALHTLQGRAAVGLYRADAARLAFKAALAAYPGHADALFRWGMLELWQGSRDEAAALLARARAVAPEASGTLRLAAEIAYAERDFAASAALYARVAEHPGPEPNDPVPPRLGQARALIYYGDVTSAEALLDRTREPGVAIYQALAAYRAGRFREASDRALPLERELAGWPPLKLLVGAAMLQTGFPNIAADRLRRYVAAMPGNEAAARLLAVAERRSAGDDAAMPVGDDLYQALGFTPPVMRDSAVP